MLAAMFAENPEVVKILIKAGADVNARHLRDNSNVLMRTDNPKVAKLLIEAGADVNIKNNQGLTPLMITNNSEIAKLFIDAGADVNAKSTGMTTLLFHTINSEVVKLLIKAGADLNGFNTSNDFINDLLQLPDNQIACDKLFHYKFGTLDYHQFLKKANELKGEDEELEQLFALKLKYFSTPKQITNNIIPKLKEFHDVAVEMKYPENKVLDLFVEYVHALKSNGGALNASKDGLKIPGFPDDLIPKISGISDDIIKIHKAIIEKNSAPKIQENFLKAIDDFAHKYEDIDKKHQDKMKEYVKAHIEGAPLSERNHDFFIKLSKAADHEEAHAESS